MNDSGRPDSPALRGEDTAVRSGPSAPNWDRIQTLFSDALERPSEERAAFLDHACAGDLELRAEIDSLLRSHEGAGSFLSDPALPGMATAAPVDALEGERVGPWRVLRLLGRGGMGAVYLAERADGEYERQVALKVVKRGMDTDAVLGRFRRERQILAGLEHPGIARFLDAGATADGRPYFVMERIDGVSLIRYCDVHELGLEARLRLYSEVCAAVQYAHSRLVVHRDLKPSNILVAAPSPANGAESRVKLLDFGIAKVLSGDGVSERTTLTSEGSRPLTPEYAAPEQLRGDTVTIATDVYSLGAVLYELVTGRTPFRLERRSPEEALRAISTGEPLAPSAAVEALGRENGDGASLRATEPRRLGRLLRGDMDTIILTALRPEPERRYPTVAALSEDLRRYLEGLPIQARSESLGYRAGKFVRRNIRALAVTAVALAAFAAMVGLHTARLAGERDRARAAAERAEEQSARAERARDFLVGVIEQSNPLRQVGQAGEPTVADLLRAARERIETELADQPELQAEMGIALGKSLFGLGDVRQALELTQWSTDQLSRLGATRNVTYAEGMHKLATYRSGVGEMRSSEDAFHESIEILRSLTPTAEVQRHLIQAHTNLANLMQRAGRPAEAVVQREAIRQAQLALHGDPDHPVIGWNWHNLGIDYTSLGRFADALPAAKEAERVLAGAFGESDARLIVVYQALVSVSAYLGQFDEADEYHQKASRLLDERFADTHPLRPSLQRLHARRLLFAGDASAATAEVRKAVEISRGIQDYLLGSALSILGTSLLVEGRYAEAAEVLDEAAAYQESIRGADHPDTRQQRVLRAAARWHVTRDPAMLDEGIQNASALVRGDQREALHLADAAAWLAAALEGVDAVRSAEWRTHAERAFAAVYPADHPWRSSLAGTRR